MGREGKNPLKWQQKGFDAADVTVVTVVHIPQLASYWVQALDVLRLCLNSTRAHTRVPFDFMVFDNGSCAEVHNCLLECLRNDSIQYLYTSKKNIGKTAAENQLFAAAPGKIVSYMDCDVLCLDGWLERSIEVLTTFEKAGMVTAQCLRLLPETYHRDIRAAAAADPDIEIREGNSVISQEHLKAYSIGLGEIEEQYNRRVYEGADLLLTKRGVGAYVNALHFQFTSWKHVLAQVLPLPTSMLLGDDDYALDDGILQAGYWKLCTTEYLVHHMGNRIPDFARELPWLGTRSPSEVPVHRAKRSRILQSTAVRAFLRRINVLTYNLLYD